MPYLEEFLAATKTAVTSPNSLEQTTGLLKHPLFKKSHPTPEHFLPLIVSVAAAGENDKLEEVLMTKERGGWATWKWSNAVDA